MDKDLEKILIDVLRGTYNRIIFDEERIVKEIAGDSLSLKEFYTLDVISSLKNSGNNTAGNIAKVLGITISTCTINLNRLIKKGFVAKKKGIEDGRIAYIELTSKGLGIKQKRDIAHTKKIENAVGHLSTSEKVFLMNTFNKLDM